jgi:pimeloyl-ACP methyl ester carboxylesterase
MQIALGRGRKVEVAQFGAPEGRPVVYCHGFPASRLDAQLAHDAACEAGVRLIALDRPGYGGSDFQPGRRMRDWPADVAAAADALGIRRFAVLAVSGGAPYGMACAALLPQRVTALGIVCGLGAMSTIADRAQFNVFARGSFRLACTAPRLSSLFTRALAPILRVRPGWTLALLAAQLPPADRAALSDPRVYAILAASLREAFRHGGRGAAHDLVLYANDWDFGFRDIKTPCYLWHGEQDTTVPVSVGKRAASRLTGCRAEFYADEGHFSLPVKRMRSILGALLAHA